MSPTDGRFYNHDTKKLEPECAEIGFGGNWYIKMGFAGFNSPANNRLGYKSKATAEAACLRYQGKSRN
jgi:hypothetical protein